MTEDIINTSGQGKNAPVLDIVVKRFNWGAFFFTWIWGIFNKSWLTFIFLGFQILQFLSGFLFGVLSVTNPNTTLEAVRVLSILFMFFVGLGLKIWFGICGNRWAWQNKRWEGVEKFHKVQKIWAIVGTVLLLIGLLAPIFIFAAYNLLYNAYYS